MLTVSAYFLLAIWVLVQGLFEALNLPTHRLTISTCGWLVNSGTTLTSYDLFLAKRHWKPSRFAPGHT